ncbi:MAG: glycosyltransferase family 25 protein [Oricola sp.]
MLKADRGRDTLIVEVVTCRKSPPGRRESATRQLEGLPLAVESEFVDGFVGEDPIVDTLYDEAANARNCKRGLSRAEIGIYASHRLAWQRLLDRGDAAALLLEDDFFFRDPALVEAILRNWKALLGDDRDIVKLFDFERKSSNVPVLSERIAGIELVKWRSPTAGMVAYLISRDGARKLLARDRIFRPVDEDIKYFWELDLNVWSAPGNPVTEISGDLGGSLVNHERERVKQRVLIRSLWGNLLTLDRKIRTRLLLAREKRAKNARKPF